MDLWGTIGVSARTGLLAAAAGLGAAALMAITIFVRRRRGSRHAGLGLMER